MQPHSIRSDTNLNTPPLLTISKRALALVRLTALLGSYLWTQSYKSGYKEWLYYICSRS